MENSGMKVKEIMSEKIISVSLDKKIDEVVNVIMDNKIHAVPVVENGKLEGIITKTDFFTKGEFNFHLPSYINFMKNLKVSGELSKEKTEEIKSLVDSRARDIMTKDCLTVLPDTEVKDIATIFKETLFHTLPVVNTEGILVGVVTVTDLLRIL